MPALDAVQLRRALASARFSQAVADTTRYGRSLTAQCQTCGRTIAATIGGPLPVGAVLVAGECKSVKGGGKIHRPEIHWMGSRIR